MNSKARIAGHSAHPIAVVFPIAFFTGAVASLLAFVGTSDSFYYRVAMVANLAGVVTAIVAMIPGTIDLLALPKPSRSRELAGRHATAALLVTGVFGLSGAWLYRGWTSRVMVDGRWDLDATVPLAIGVFGMVLLVSMAAAGWALVQRHHLGIKPARVHADRPSREPELDEPQPRPRRLVTGTDLHPVRQ